MSEMADGDIEAMLALPGEELSKKLRKKLKKHGVDRLSAWTDASWHRNSLAHRLASLGHADALELLLSARADANVQRDKDGCTPLHLALWTGQPAAVERLKILGARQDIANKHGEEAKDMERQRATNYVCWHQHADLLLTVAPHMLRRLFRERWQGYAGIGADINFIFYGSPDRRSISRTASVRKYSRKVFVEEDLRGKVCKGQRFWIGDVELKAAADPEFKESEGRLLGGGELEVTEKWHWEDNSKATLWVQVIPAEQRLPTGKDAENKIRKGKLDDWDMTLLAHFCSEDQCKLACSLVPNASHRELIRRLKDIRNTAGLHMGRTEVDPKTVRETAELVQQVCDLLVPGMSDEVRSMIDKTRCKTVIPESEIHEMKQKIKEEHERAEIMEGRLQTASRFRKHVPPGAFADDACSTDNPSDAASGFQSEWSATRVTSAWAPCGGVFCMCESAEDIVRALEMPDGCKPEVVLRCLSLAVPWPRERNLLIVIRTAATRVDDVMLQEVSASDVHRKWKDRQTNVHSVEESLEIFEDWSLPDGVLVSGDHGRILRVSAQFRPPEGGWKVKSPCLKRALNIAAAVQAVVIVSESGVLYASTTRHAQSGEYVQLRPGDGSDSEEDSDDDAIDSLSRYTATQVDYDRGPSNTAQMVGSLFRPHERGRSHVTQTLLPQAAEQVRHWGDGSEPITAGNAEQVSDNTSRWLWHMFGQSTRAEAADALECCNAVLKRLEVGGFRAFIARLLHPMGEIRRAWEQLKEAEELFNRCRILAKEHRDFENGFASLNSLFNLYVQQGKTDAAREALEVCQKLVNDERENREGPGMKDFSEAKQMFLSTNFARLDAKLALMSKDPAALLKVHEQLERIDREMSQRDQDSMLRGNTDANHAELLNLWYIVSMARFDTEAARTAVERELPLRRQLAQGTSSMGERGCYSKLAKVLENLGRVHIALRDYSAAEATLSEAQDVAQGLMSAPNPPRETMAAIHRLRGRCFQHAGDVNAALVQLERAIELGDAGASNDIKQLLASYSPGASNDIKQLQNATRRRAPRGNRRLGETTGETIQALAEEDSRSLDELTAFIEGNVSKASKKIKKTKLCKMPEIREEDGDAGATVSLTEQEKKHSAEPQVVAGEDDKVDVAREALHEEDDAEEEATEEGVSESTSEGTDKAKAKKKKSGKKKKR